MNQPGLYASAVRGLGAARLTWWAHAALLGSLWAAPFAAAGQGQPCTGEPARRQIQTLEAQPSPSSQSLVAALAALAECARRAGDNDVSVTALERALHHVQQVDGEVHVQTAAVQDRLAQAMVAAGRADEAIPHWRAAVTTLDRLNGSDHPDTAAVTSRLASALADRGAHAEALALRERVVGTYTRIGNPALLATALSNLGNSLDELGQDELALQRREQALRLLDAQPQRDARQYAVLLHELARSHLLAGRADQALATQERAVAEIEAAPARDAAVALALRAQRAEALLAAGQPEWARSEVLALVSTVRAEQGDEAPVLSGLWRLAARASVELGQVAQALPLLHAAHRVALTSGNPERQWRVLANLAAVHGRLGEPDAAILFGKQAVQIVQGLRAELTTLDVSWQETHARAYHALYQGLADQLVAAGRVGEAQGVLDLLKRRELDDLVVRGGTPARQRVAPTAGAATSSASEVPLTGLEKQLFDRYARLRDEQVALGQERQRLDRRALAGALSAEERARLEELETRLIPQMTDAFNRFLAAMQKELDASRARPPRSGEPTRDEETPRLGELRDELRNAVTRLRKLEPTAHAVALQYVVSEDRLSIILYTPDAPPVPRQISVSRRELNKRIGEVTLMLSNPRSDAKIFLPALQQLHAWLIAPVAADLRAAGAQTLMLSLNDVLRYLPFAALHDGQRFLVQDYALAWYNSAARTTFERSSPRPWRVAAMGLTQAVDGLEPLPKVKEELQGVVSARGVSGNPYLDQAFDRRRLRNSVAGDDYNAVHVASHFKFVAGRAEQSQLYLGDKSRLTLADIEAQDWLFPNTSLLTLSACETGRGGGRDEYGQEIDGLGALVQRRGAQAVMVTLWKIADDETPLFMRGFYEALAQGPNKAQALRRTQLAYVQRDGRIGGREISNRARHPFFWAPFVMMGNWR